MTPETVTHFQSRFTDENAQKQADDLGLQFTDTFVQDPEHVTLLLTLLEVQSGFDPAAETLYCFPDPHLMLFCIFRSLTFMYGGPE